MKPALRTLLLGTAVAASLCAAVACSPQPDSTTTDAESAEASVPSIVASYLDSYFETFPSRATSEGLHDYDGALELLDESIRGEWIDLNRRVGEQLESLLETDLPTADRLDAELLLRRTRRVRFDWEVLDRPHHDPLFWTRMLANSTVFLLVREDRPAEVRLAAAAERARRVPLLAAVAQGALAEGDPAEISRDFVEIAARQMRSAARFHREGFPRAAAVQAPELEEDLRVAGELAAVSLDELADFLDELAEQATGSPRLGERYAEIFELHSAEERSPAEVLADAERALIEKRAETAEYGRSVWAEIGMAGSPPDDDVVLVRRLFERVAEDHAETVEEFVADYKALLLEAEAFARQRGIVTLPDPLTVSTDRSPEFFTGQGVGGVYAAGPYEPEAQTLFYLPTPSESYTDEQREAFFRDFNHHFNVMITPHEMVPGHYLQGKVAARLPRKARSLFSDGVYTEGWGTFCERLMLDEGWGDPLARLAHLKKQMENIARTIVDIRVHTLEMTRDEVLAFVQEEALQEAHFARNMWSRAITSAPQITSYWLGYDQHMALFEDYKAAKGEDFVLREYMDAMVSEGGIPVSAYRELLLGDG